MPGKKIKSQKDFLMGKDNILGNVQFQKSFGIEYDSISSFLVFYFFLQNHYLTFFKYQFLKKNNNKSNTKTLKKLFLKTIQNSTNCTGNKPLLQGYLSQVGHYQVFKLSKFIPTILMHTKIQIDYKSKILYLCKNKHNFCRIPEPQILKRKRK